MLKVAMISKWHVHAEGYAREINESGDACVSCVWDEIPERGEKWAQELNVPFIRDYDKLLKRDDVDAVLFCTPTNMHKELMIKAAKAKKHIFTEKVMCLTVKDCDEVIEAVKENGIVFTISFPHRITPENLFIKNAIESGMLGKITLFRVRNCHNGALANWLPDYWYDPETTGGGAMMDLGAHPMYLSRWFLGKPNRIQSTFSFHTGHAVDDDAVSVIGFESGAVAISETSLVSPLTPKMMEVYGTNGVILCQGKTLKMKLVGLESKDNDGWIEPKLPAADPMPIRQWLNSVLYGAPVKYGLEEGRQLTELMENAYKAHELKKEIQF